MKVRPTDIGRARGARAGEWRVVVDDVELVLSRGSVVRPTVVLERDVVRGEAARVSTAIGASTLAWEGEDDWEHWRRCFAPMTTSPLRGSPDASARWAVVDEIDIATLPSRAEPGWQWHVLVRAEHPTPAHVVQWRAEARTAAPLLGAAEVIVGRGGPLVWDAWRLGRRVVVPHDGAIDRAPSLVAPDLDSRLAHTIPPLLFGLPGFWEDLARRAASEGPIAPALDAATLRWARELASTSARRPLGAARRAWRRLQEEPVVTLREARAWLERTITSRARRTPARRNP